MAANSFDVVVIWTTLCQVAEPCRVLGEAYRVLRPGGCLVVFDGDYAGTTVAVQSKDPLQECVHTWMTAMVRAPWIARHVPAMVAEAGFVAGRVASHAYTSVDDTNYMLTIVDRGADAMSAAGGIKPGWANALKNYARDRAATGRFFGQIVYLSLLARKPV